MTPGAFITFEGPEGSGKSTHCRLLADFLRSRGAQVLLTREPGGTPTGEAIRDILQHNASGEPPVAQAEALLFFASRAQHVAQVIRPALDRGVWVLCDRFADSTLAYQGYGRGFDLSLLREINAFATGGLQPRLTLLLDATPEVSRHRLAQRLSHEGAAAPDRIEQETAGFHMRLRDGFLALARQEPDRFVVIATERDKEAVGADIREAVQRRLAMPCN